MDLASLITNNKILDLCIRISQINRYNPKCYITQEEYDYIQKNYDEISQTMLLLGTSTQLLLDYDKNYFYPSKEILEQLFEGNSFQESYGDIVKFECKNAIHIKQGNEKSVEDKFRFVKIAMAHTLYDIKDKKLYLKNKDFDMEIERAYFNIGFNSILTDKILSEYKSAESIYFFIQKQFNSEAELEKLLDNCRKITFLRKNTKMLDKFILKRDVMNIIERASQMTHVMNKSNKYKKNWLGKFSETIYKYYDEEDIKISKMSKANKQFILNYIKYYYPDLLLNQNINNFEKCNVISLTLDVNENQANYMSIALNRALKLVHDLKPGENNFTDIQGDNKYFGLVNYPKLILAKANILFLQLRGIQTENNEKNINFYNINTTEYNYFHDKEDENVELSKKEYEKKIENLKTEIKQLNKNKNKMQKRIEKQQAEEEDLKKVEEKIKQNQNRINMYENMKNYIDNKGKVPLTDNDFFRHIRNSISHGNIEIEKINRIIKNRINMDNLRITFNDYDEETQSKLEFKCTMTVAQFLELSKKVALNLEKYANNSEEVRRMTVKDLNNSGLLSEEDKIRAIENDELKNEILGIEKNNEKGKNND